VGDCDKPGKHPATAGGVNDATTNADTINDWWNQNPLYGVAIATGKASGISGLDIDVKNGKQGDLTLAQLRGKEAMPEALCVETPSGGRHYYFGYDKAVKTAVAPYGPDLDTRNEGGYLVAPPSAHVAGGKYKWLTTNWQKIDPVAWPPWLRKVEAGEKGTGGVKKERFDARNPKAVASVKHAIQFIDPSNYDRWIQVGFILGRAFAWNDEGFAIYSEWSSNAGATYNHKKTHALYYKDSRKIPKKPLNTASIFEWAGENDAFVAMPADVARQFTVVDDRTDVPAVADQLAQIAAHSPAIFRRNGELVFLAGHVIFRHTPKTLVLELSRHVTYLTTGADGKLRCGPVPEHMAAMVLERRAGDAKPLQGVSGYPVFRPDWSIACEPGYDPGTAMFVSCEAIAPDKDGARLLRSLVSDFPWSNPVDESIFFAALFTVGLRHLFPTAPIFGFSAYAPGSGKSLLVDVISMIWFGRRAAKSIWPEKEDEMGKVLAANSLSGAAMIVFDNIDRGEKVHDAALCAMLTSDTMRMRILGKTEFVEMDTHTTVMATGNDLTFTGDTARRSMLCTIDVKSDAPDKRDDFKIPDLLVHIQAHRKQYLAAAIGVVLEWVKAGRPLSLYRKGGFEEWAAVVGGIVEKTGVPPLTEYGAHGHGQIDESSEVETQFLTLLSHTLYAETTATYSTIELTQRIQTNSELRAAFKSVYPVICTAEYRKNRAVSAPFEVNATTVGRLFGAMNGRWREAEDAKPSAIQPSATDPKAKTKAKNGRNFVGQPVLRVVLILNRVTKQRRWTLEENKT
jgi:hypothetical protein